MRGMLAIIILICSVGAGLAQGRDMNDRTIGIEMNRDRSEGRVQRLQEEKRDSAKARAESKSDASDRSKKKSDDGK